MRWMLAILVSVHCAAIAESDLKMGLMKKKAQALFASGKCDQVIELGLKLSKSDQVDDLNALVQTETIVARCYFQRKQMKNAQDQLRHVLFLKPDFELDAFETPAPLVEAFNKEKSELAQKTLELQSVKENANQKSEVLETKVVVRKMSALAPLIPFGFAQFEYGAQTKGIIIAALEAGFLAANIGSYWAKRSFASSESSNLVSDQGALANYNLAQGFQFASLGLFMAVYIFGSIDGYIHKDEVTFESSQSESRRLSRDEFLQKLDQLKKKGS
jgi:hypothetical protein